MPAFAILFLCAVLAPALTVGGLWAAGRCLLGMEGARG